MLTFLSLNQQVLAQVISCCTLLREHFLTIGSFSLGVEDRGLIFVIVGELCRIVRIKGLGFRLQDFAGKTFMNGKFFGSEYFLVGFQSS